MTDLPDWATGLRSPLENRLGVEVLQLTAEQTVGRMPVEGNTQPVGLLHGGASCALAEGLGSMAAYAYGRDRQLVPIGVDINATHHKAVRSGWVTGTARPLFLGSRTVSYDIVIVDDSGDRVCTARLTCQLQQVSHLPEG